MREKKRYLLVAIEGTGPAAGGPAMDEKSAKHLVYEAVFQLLGEAGAAEAGFQFKSFDAARNAVVVKCRTAALEKVVAALAAKRRWKGGDIALRVKKISGMVSNVM
ncbi:MAG: Rpp14/Pop5 family protein [Candidatus Micrarchaeota archaeon]|nr:Rpp14/Pop5 family protein [Candidatus Micrarchaeota archaeon]